MAAEEAAKSARENRADYADQLNRLRAAVLGANDGIVSIAGAVVGVAAATTNVNAIIIAAIATVSAGALSMAVGEYVSVSSQRDSEMSVLASERRDLEADRDGQVEELVRLHVEHGLSEQTARLVAAEEMENDAVGAIATMKHGIVPGDYVNPMAAAIASFFSFLVGGAIPALACTLGPAAIRIPLTFAMVVVALAITGYLSAKTGRAPIGRAILRNIIGGSIAMGITYTVGTLVGVSV